MGRVQSSWWFHDETNLNQTHTQGRTRQGHRPKRSWIKIKHSKTSSNNDTVCTGCVSFHNIALSHKHHISAWFIMKANRFIIGIGFLRPWHLDSRQHALVTLGNLSDLEPWEIWWMVTCPRVDYTSGDVWWPCSQRALRFQGYSMLRPGVAQQENNYWILFSAWTRAHISNQSVYHPILSATINL